MDRETHHVWGFVETLLGPVIYLGFFGLTYLANSLVCTLSRGNNPAIGDPQAAVNISVLGLTLIAVVLIAWHTANGFRLLRQGPEDREDAFMGLVSVTLSLLSAVAVLWTALPAATLPSACQVQSGSMRPLRAAGGGPLSGPAAKTASIRTYAVSVRAQDARAYRRSGR